MNGGGVVDGFSLIDEPWILVRTAEGATEEVSLLELFRRAPQLVEIVGDLPTQAFAILRLALAVLHRAVEGPRDEDHWWELWEAGGPPVEAVEAYLERYRDRFDLFHPTTPFFQVADLRTAKDEVFGFDRLIADLPPRNRLFTTRAGAGATWIDAADAARWLVHLQAFDWGGIKSGALGDPRVKKGKGYGPGLAWCGRIGGVYVDGGSVWRTLLLNAIPWDQPSLALRRPDDVPSWERAPDTACEDNDLASRPSGPVDLFTWQSRRVRLRRSGNGVDGVLVALGDKLEYRDRGAAPVLARMETMSAWRTAVGNEPARSKFGGPDLEPVLHDPSRALWRGLEALLPVARDDAGLIAGGRYRPPAVLTWAAQALGGRARVTLRAVGLTYAFPKREAVTGVVDDRLGVHGSVLDAARPALAYAVLDAVRASEAAVEAVRDLVSNLAAASGGGMEARRGARARAAERAYALLDGPFRSWLAGLDADADPEWSRIAWYRTARRLLHRLGDELVDQAGAAAWVGRDVRNRRVTAAEADGWFRGALARALPVPAEEEVVA